MPMKAGYLALIGAGAVVAYSGIKGKGIGSAFRATIQGNSPATAKTANRISGNPVGSYPGGYFPVFGGGNVPINGYVNPLGRVKGVQPSRVDMGVDYYGPGGPVVAIGAARIMATYNRGWPFRHYIGMRLLAGPYKGLYVYYAEDIVPTVHMGQIVQPGEVVGIMGSQGVEFGWAAPPGVGGTMAALNLQWPNPGSYPTAYGASFNRLMTSLGAPSGTFKGQPVGSIGKRYP